VHLRALEVLPQPAADADRGSDGKTYPEWRAERGDV
jgi:hypothetical protein